jgi:ADP-ribose pyrophosphatase YjhB (NUDIX family)
MKVPKVDATWYERPPGVRERHSAGGVVVREEEGSVLAALAREGNWPSYVLPKGGIKRGEDAETAARREIAEEIGLTELELIAPLGTRERCGYNKKTWVITHFFLFATAQEMGVPLDPKHHGMWWYPLDELPPMLWPEQRALIEECRELVRVHFRKT